MHLRSIIRKIAKHISKTNQYTKDQEEQVEYALRIIVFETLKIIGVSIIFNLMGYPVEAIIVLGTMSITKPYIGGYHEETQIKCFIATLIIVGSIIWLSINLNLDFVSKLIFNTVTFYCIWNQAPVINPKMQLTRIELIKRNRILAIAITLVMILISTVFYKNIIVSNTIIWTMVFQVLLMFNKRKLTQNEELAA